MKSTVLALTLLFVSLPLLSKPVLEGESEGMKFVVEEIASGLNIPWGFAFIDPNTMIFTERNGKISLLDLRTGKIQAISGTPTVYEVGQGGLLDIALHPDYPNQPWIYITFSEEKDGQGVTTLARFQLKDSKVTQLQRLLVTDSRTKNDVHFGSRIAFDKNGKIYFSVGERGERKNAQDLSNHAGKILRLNLDGSVPSDNPFVGQKGKRPEIWSYGQRNPQGLLYDATANRLWEIEHGPRGGDELNLIQKGKNYGWPVTSYGKEYHLPLAVGVPQKAGIADPVHYYVPSIAPSGLDLYSGGAFPKWKGNLFTGALVLTHLNRIVLNGEQFVKEERLLGPLNLRIRNVKEGPSGHLYLSTDQGSIMVIKPKGT